MADEAKDVALVNTLSLYDRTLEEQDVLNGHVKEGLMAILQARVMLEMSEATELTVEDYPENTEARCRIFGNKKGDPVPKQIQKVQNPCTHFARSRDALGQPQAHFLKAIESACKLASLRADLTAGAKGYAELK